ncbi:MAG: L,D-transpeptidase [Pseudobdellovibrionaceae bacterium]
MKKQMVTLSAVLLLSLAFPAHSEEKESADVDKIPNMIEQLNPSDPNVEEILEYYDKIYEEETGKPSHIIDDTFIDNLLGLPSCYRNTCTIWVQIVKASQRMYLYEGGSLSNTWLVSTGKPGYTTPNFDRHPDGRIYDAYTSTKFPDGDYNGLGNMPYAVFITGGYAIHGTPKGNWPRLGKPASHGCIRLLPDNAFIFNRLVRKYGVRNVWITIQ